MIDWESVFQRGCCRRVRCPGRIGPIAERLACIVLICHGVIPTASHNFSFFGPASPRKKGKSVSVS